MLILTAQGVMFGCSGNTAEAEAAMQRGYLQVAPSMFVSTVNARIDVLHDAPAAAQPDTATPINAHTAAALTPAG